MTTNDDPWSGRKNVQGGPMTRAEAMHQDLGIVKQRLLRVKDEPEARALIAERTELELTIEAEVYVRESKQLRQEDERERSKRREEICRALDHNEILLEHAIDPGGRVKLESKIADLRQRLAVVEAAPLNAIL